MDSAGVGALIGIGIMGFSVIVCLIRDRCQQKKVNEKTRLVDPKKETPVLIQKPELKKKPSVRDILPKSPSFELKTVRVS